MQKNSRKKSFYDVVNGVLEIQTGFLKFIIFLS